MMRLTVVAIAGLTIMTAMLVSCGQDKPNNPADTTPPAAVNDLAITVTSDGSVSFTWTAPGDDGSIGRATEYDFRHSELSITEENWDNATVVDGEPAPASAGETESYTIDGLSPATTYYFGLKTIDEAGNNSALSNIDSTTTLPDPAATWERAYGSSSSDGAKKIISINGGYVITGWTRDTDSGEEDFYLLKIDESGDVIWENAIGGDGYDYGWDIVETNGGFTTVGVTRSYGTVFGNMHLISTDAAGNQQWHREYGGDVLAEGFGMTAADDGSVVLAGYRRNGLTYDAYLVRVDQAGNTVWEKPYGGESGNQIAYSIVSTADGGFAVAGYTDARSAATRDLWILRVDSDGDSLWAKSFGGENTDAGYDIARTDDGGFIIAGTTSSSGAGFNDLYLLKTTADGDSSWAKTLGGADDDYGWSVARAPDGGYIVCGQTKSFGAGGDDVYLVKTDESGNLVWEKTFGGANDDRGSSVALTPAGGYIVTGWTKSMGAGSADVYIVKVNANGEIE